MKQEDYSRGVRAINDIQPDDRAALTVILKDDGSLFVSNVGEPDNIGELYDKFADYCDKIADRLKDNLKKNLAMKSKEAINFLNCCIGVLEIVEEKVREKEDDEICFYAAPRSSLKGSSVYIHVAISRIRSAVKRQG